MNTPRNNKRRRKYPRIPTDTESGIRRIDEIDKLPSCQLTDEEFVKAFYARFDARAMVILYYDVEGKSYIFGRLHRAAIFRSWYKGLIRTLGKALGAEINDGDTDYFE